MFHHAISFKALPPAITKIKPTILKKTTEHRPCNFFSYFIFLHTSKNNVSPKLFSPLTTAWSWRWCELGPCPVEKKNACDMSDWSLTAALLEACSPFDALSPTLSSPSVLHPRISPAWQICRRSRCGRGQYVTRAKGPPILGHPVVRVHRARTLSKSCYTSSGSSKVNSAANTYELWGQ